jgi:hypothetical protein
MTKRLVSVEAQPQLLPPFPPEIIDNIAAQYYPKTTQNVFSFLLVCREWEKYLPTILRKWATHVLVGLEKGGTEDNAMQIYLSTTYMNYYYLVSLYEKGVGDEFLKNLFDLQKHICATKYWVYKGQRNRVLKPIPSTRVSDIFYHDKKNGTVVRLYDIPGIKIFYAPDRPAIGLKALVEKTYANDLIKEIAREGIETLPPEKRILFYYKMCVHHDIPIYNETGIIPTLRCVVINNNHIYSEEEETKEIYDNLYTCNYDGLPEKSYPEYCKEYVVLQSITEEDRSRKILQKLGFSEDVYEHEYNSNGDE